MTEYSVISSLTVCERFAVPRSLLALPLPQVKVIFVDQQEMAEAQQVTVPDQCTPLWAPPACSPTALMLLGNRTSIPASVPQTVAKKSLWKTAAFRLWSCHYWCWNNMIRLLLSNLFCFTAFIKPLFSNSCNYMPGKSKIWLKPQ